MEVFQDYAYYYNLFYGNKNYAKEANIVHDFIQKYQPDAKSILDMGCGTGRHDKELLKYDYVITGIDMSQDMLDIAKESITSDIENKLEFELADVREYKAEQKFDAVMSLFHVMSYQTTNGDILSAFQTAYDALEEGGLFIFDCWYGPGVLTERPELRIKEIEDDKNKVMRIARPVLHANENMVDVCYEVLVTEKNSNVTKRIDEVHHMRYFFLPEIEEYLKMSGFELLEVVDCDTLEEPDFESWTVYLVGRKGNL